jgi:glycosyl transferase family 25
MSTMSALSCYCINLEKRTDRWQECLQNFASFGLPASLIQRWPAYEDSFGALGCAKSHVAVLADFIVNHSEPYCLVLEDDFDLLRPWNDFVNLFNEVQHNGLDWDALLLAGTCTLAYPEGPTGLARILESQSTVGYMLQRRYVPAVLHTFAHSVCMLEKFRTNVPREPWTHRFAIDQAWKVLQRDCRWFIFTPTVGHQRESFSDIEQKQVNYSDITWRGKQQ